MNRTLALVRRALQVDGRDIRPHLFRCGLAAVVLFTLTSIQMNGRYRAAPGRDLFSWLMYYNYWFVTAAGATFFATAITEEKEERTLSLMKMAGVGATSILAGKWIPRLIGALLLILIQIPFTALAITLGGVLWGQVWAAYVAVIAHLFLVGNVGLLASVVSPTMSRACGWSIVILLLFHILPPMFRDALTSLVTSRTPSDGVLMSLVNFFETGVEMCAVWRIGSIMVTGFKDSPWSFQVISNLIGGGVLLFMSWLLFEPCTRNEVEPGVESAWWTKLRHTGTIGPSRRSWENSLVWKEFHYLAGGMSFLLLKCAGYALLVVFVVIMISGWNFNRIDNEMFAGVAFMIGVWGLILEIAAVSTRVYRNEMTQQTWSVLSMLPMSMPTVAYTKLFGGLLAVVPAALCACSCFFFAPDDVLEVMGDILTEPDAMIIVFFMTTQVLFGLHVATFLSISARWAVWPLSIFLGGFAVFLFNLMVVACVANASGSEEGFVFLLGCMTVVIIVVLHINIGRRLVAMASE